MDFLSQHEVYAPDFLFEEIKYLKIVPKIAIRPGAWEKAHNLCKTIDEKDTPFLALCLELNLPLKWKSLTAP